MRCGERVRLRATVRLPAVDHCAAPARCGMAGPSTCSTNPPSGCTWRTWIKLIRVLPRLVDAGNTVVVIEHNLDVIAEADTVIDLGPEGGAGGGRVVAMGAPEEIAGARGSHTGEALARFLDERR